MSIPRGSTIGIVLLFTVIAGYSIVESRALILGPSLTITSPLDGAVISESAVRITGTGKNISAIKLNDRPIFVDAEGYFSEELLLPLGYTILSMKAEDRFGRGTEMTLRLFRNS